MPLIIGAEQKQTIVKLQSHAARNVCNPEEMLRHARRDLLGFRLMMQSFSLVIPIGYYVTYCHETQPIGVCHHISISVERSRKVPAPEAIEMILQEFGMTPIQTSLRVWVEDVTSTRVAVNLLQPLA